MEAALKLKRGLAVICQASFFLTPKMPVLGNFKETTSEYADVLLRFAEREGFEPPDPRRSTVFKTAAIDRSAISPLGLQS